MFKYKFDASNLVERRTEDSAETRSPIFKLEMPNRDRFINSTAYLLKQEWYNLPLSIRSVDDYENFKMIIKRFFRDLRGNFPFN